MIWQIIKRIGLTLLRNPTQLFLFLGLPIILIAILGAALGDVMNGENPTVNAKVAMMEHGDEEEQINHFVSNLKNSELPEEKVKAISTAAEQIKPVSILKNSVLGSEGLKEVIQVETIKPSERENVLNDDSYTAVIEVPESFTYDTLQNFFGMQTASPSLRVYQNGGKKVGAPIILGVLDQFQKQLSLQRFVNEKGFSMEAIQVDTKAFTSEIKTINQQQPVSAKNYYTIGMAVMNVLFIASTIGSYAFLEKKIHVFDRIILADVSRWVYFIGVFVAGSAFGSLHLLMVFGMSWILFGVTWPNIPAFLFVTLGLALAVGGLTVLLTAISYRINSELITNFFSSFIVSIIAFFGGSFFPVGNLSKIIQVIGDVTPNGAGMTAYLHVLRGDGISAVLNNVLFLGVFAIMLIIIAALSFPKRGQTT